jgi:hypothetical protein
VRARSSGRTSQDADGREGVECFSIFVAAPEETPAPVTSAAAATTEPLTTGETAAGHRWTSAHSATQEAQALQAIYSDVRTGGTLRAALWLAQEPGF